MTPGNAAADRLAAKYGRTPPTQTEPPPPTAAKPSRASDPCPVCGLHRDGHHPCPVCRGPIEHHPDGVTPAEEWEGLARMATAKRDAGGTLTSVEAEALRRVPAPEFLCSTCAAYRERPHTCAPVTSPEAFACPRCSTSLPAEASFGPCAPCRVQLREIADHRYAGWFAVHFLAGRLVDLKPAIAAQDPPGAPAGEPARAPDPESVSGPHSGPSGVPS